MPRLGELAVQAGLIRQDQLELLLDMQREQRARGDFRRLGELLAARFLIPIPRIRELLERQGVVILGCTLCLTCYNALGYRRRGNCLRCGRRLRPAPPEAPITVEDAISEGTPPADTLLREHRRHNPRVGAYEVLGEVGRGGMGVVYKAWDHVRDRYVALKFILGAMSLEDRVRFRREAALLTRLRHEHIVRGHAFEEQAEMTFLVMDFVAGVPLDLLTEGAGLPPEFVVASCIPVARALHAAHEEGFLHRDVKPENVIVDWRGEPYLVDFGLAKDTEQNLHQTDEDEVLGSLAYMAPEYAARGHEALDRRCDVYGLGVVLYEALSGGFLPYGDPSDMGALMSRIAARRPTLLIDIVPDLPEVLRAIVMRAVAADADLRQQSAAELADELEAFLVGRQVPEFDIDRFVLSLPPAPSPRAPAPEPTWTPPPRTFPRDSCLALALAVLGLIAAVWLGVIAYGADRRAEQRVHEALQAEMRSGAALERAGELEAAEEAYTRATRLPNDGAPFAARARLREARGDAEGAAADRASATARGHGGR